MRFLSIVMVLVVSLASLDAEAARRLGGGKSMGKQSSNVTQREAAPAAPAAPAKNATATPAPTAPTAPAPQVAPKRPWGAMLGGLAAGLGLAWLAHSLGFGEAFGQILMVALLAFVAMALIGWLLRSRRSATQPSAASPFGLQPAAAGTGVTGLRSYSPDHVGNDASARPWERNSMSFEPSKQPGEGGRLQAGNGVVIGSALGGQQTWGIPEGFDSFGFLEAAKRNFVTLQDAWDRSDVATLRSMMTDSMVSEIQAQLSEREMHTGKAPNKTEVLVLEAQLLGIEDLGDGYMASVEFSGMIREDLSVGPAPFREVWNMTKPKSGTVGWLVAGVQALQ